MQLKQQIIFSLLIFTILIAGCVSSSGSQKAAQEQNKDSAAGNQQNTGSTINSLSGCPPVVFTVEPMARDSYTRIMPIGNLNPPSHTTPSDHLYFALKGTQDAPVPATVYAPSDMYIYSISQTKVFDNSGNLKYEDYSVQFSPCKEILAGYGHIIISDELKAAIANKNCRKEGQMPPNAEQCEYDVDYKIKAGEIVGTVGDPISQSHALDFTVHDSRVTLTGFANPARYREEYFHTACALDYYNDSVKSFLKSRLGDLDKTRTREPVCGTVMQDLVGTAQGVWFDGPATDGSIENHGKAVALVHDNDLGTYGKLVAGGEVAGPGMITFTPKHSGTINREFGEITADGKIYCYSDEGGNFMQISGKIILQLVDSNTLKIEHQTGSCGQNEAFVKPWTYER